MSEFIEVGYISGFFGVSGEVKIYSFTRPMGEIIKYKNFYLGEDKTPLKFARIRQNDKHIIAKIDGKNNRNDVLGLNGLALFVLAKDLPDLAEGEYYWRDLLGLTVINQDKIELGKIESIFETGANDVLVIKNSTGEEILIPYVMEHFILAVDLAKKQMQVDWQADWETDKECDDTN